MKFNDNLVDIKEYAEKRERRKSTARKALSVGTFLGPYTISFLMFFVFPLVFGIVMSFSKFSSQSFLPVEFGTLENFKVLFGDTAIARAFWNSVWTTIKFCACIVPLSIVIPLALALLINLKPPGYKFFRAAIYVPGIFPLTATGLILMRLFDSHYGWINSVFNLTTDWFGEVGACWFMIGLLCIWCGIGGNFIIYCAGLENVDKTLYEVANVDGCSAWKKFWHVTLPGIRPQIFLTLFTTLIGYMNVYGQIFILGSNNPDLNEMKSAVYRIQDLLAGSNSRVFGYAAAMGICLGLIIVVIAITQLLLDKEKKGGGKRVQKFRQWKENK
ncbi:MAG: carbohydrate ABC transporter permease [Candidatus Fimimonas sp.]